MIWRMMLVLVMVAGVMAPMLAFGGTAAADGPDTPGCTLERAIPVAIDQKYEESPSCPSGTWYKLDMDGVQRPVTIRMYFKGGPWSGMRSPFQVWTRGSGTEKFTKIGEATYKGSPWPGVSEWSWTGQGASPVWIFFVAAVASEGDAAKFLFFFIVLTLRWLSAYYGCPFGP